MKMNERMKKVFSILLCLCMVAQYVPTMVFAAEGYPICTCDTDDALIHATTCAVYVAPENPVCYCTEKCSDTNEWCDVCGFDYTQCGGTDTATVYSTSGYDFVDTSCGLTYKILDSTNKQVEVCGYLGETANITISATVDNADIAHTVTSIGDSAFSGCTFLESVTISNDITTIGNNAFSGCTSLESVTIPSSVNNIGSAPFKGCTSLKTITVDSDNTSYSCDIGNTVLLNKAKTELICYAAGADAESCYIPLSVTQIADSAFYGCTKLKTVTIPNGVTTIGANAFNGCSALTSAALPSSVTTIGDGAFKGTQVQCATHRFTEGACDVCDYTCSHASYKDGTCTVCGYVCTHSGGEATCKGQQCENCGEWYGELGGHTFDSATGKCGVCGETLVAAVTVNGVKTYYTTFPDVVNLYRTQDITLELLADADYSYQSSYSVEGTWTVDLNGHRFSAKNEIRAYGFRIEGTFTVNGPGEAAGSIYVDKGKLIIAGKEAPTIDKLTVREDDDCEVIFNIAPQKTVELKLDNLSSKTVFIKAGEGVDLSIAAFELASHFPNLGCYGLAVNKEGNLYVKNNGDHTGGEATCTAQAVCEICGTSYGKLADHSMGYTAEGMTITHKCATCDTQTVTFTLVIPTNAVYGSSALEVPHYDCSDQAYNGELPVITLDENFGPNAGTYEVSMTWGGQTVTGQYTIAQAETVFATFKTDTETNTFTYGDTITITVNPVPSGNSVPFVEGLGDKLTLWFGETQISRAVAVNGVYTMTYDTSEKTVPTGTQTLTVKFAGNEQMLSCEGKVDITLNSKELTVSVTPTDRAYEPGNTTVAVTAELNGSKLGSDSVDLNAVTTGTIDSDIAGSHTVTLPTFTLTGEHEKWYSVVQPEGVTVNITKADASDSMKAASGILCKNGTSTVVLPELPSTNMAHGTPTFDAPVTSAKLNNGILTVTGSADVVVGDTYTVEIYVFGGDNYNDYAITVTLTGKEHEHVWSYTASGDTITATCEGEIGQCPIGEQTITIMAQGKSYNGTAVTATLDGSVEGVTAPAITYFRDGEELNESVIDAGTYTARITIGGATASVEFTIAPMEISHKPLEAAWVDMTYNGSPQTPKGTVTMNDPVYPFSTITGSWSPVTNVGELSTFTASGNFTGTIARDPRMRKAVPVVTMPTAKTLTYDGTAQALVNPGKTTGGTMVYSMAEDGTYGSIPEASNAGTYHVWYKVVGNSNYKDTTPTWVEVTITPMDIRSATVTLDNTLTYNGQEQTQTVSKVEINGLTVTCNVSGNEQTNAGSYALTVTGNGNFKGTATKAWSIAKAEVTITADNKVIYVGAVPTLTYRVSGLMANDELINAPALTSNVNTAVAGSYVITATNADAGENYEIFYTGGTLTVMDAETEAETQIVHTELAEVPEELQDTKFNTVQAITQELISRIQAVSNGYAAENMEHYDVTLQFSLDGGNTWIHATEENFPTEGITVVLPYPEGTNPRDYDFLVSHMFSVTSQRLGTTAGEVEMPQVEETANGIRVTLNGLSPVTVAAKYHDHTGGTATCADKAVCSVCGIAYGEVDKTNHTGGTEVKNTKEATCGAEGYTGDTCCKGCGEVIEKGTAIKATGAHIYGEWKIVKPATTQAKYVLERVCEICGHAEQKYGNILGDANGDGLVNAIDAMLILKFYTKKIDETKLDVNVCDVDGNGYINAKDAMLILKFYTKKIEQFPAA